MRDDPDPMPDADPDSSQTRHLEPSPASEHPTRSTHAESTGQERLGPYRILELVGTGGMGEVYRAEQMEPIRRTVALKIIKRGMDTKEVMTRFEAERQALALMDHPNIAKVFEAGSTPRGRPYFVMEFVRGIPINAYCDDHNLSTRERLALFIELCEGVQHAHQKAIIHRDLKPSNVLVTIQDNKPVPKIIDFGVAKATAQKLTEKTMYTALGEMIGTPEYMSPEQAAMTGEDVDTRTDVYSLGVILYELLSGALPFEPAELHKAGFEGIVRMIREQDPPRPSTKVGTLGDRWAGVARARRTIPAKLTGQLRGDLDWITMRALEKDRTRRYGSPSELAADIRRHLQHEPVLAGPPTAAYRLRKFVRRHTMGVGIAAAGALVLLAFAVMTAVQNNRAIRERDRADQEARTSHRVSEFLVSVFNVSDPGEARGNSITAREILDNGALRIRRELQDQPLLRARMMDSMGRVYQNLGLYTVAESLLAGALALRQAHLGDDHLDTAASRAHLGWLHLYQGRYDEGRIQCQQALAVRQHQLGPEHVDTAWSLYYLGVIEVFSYECQGRRMLERALPIFERELGPTHLAVAWCHNDLGNSLLDADDPDAALPHYERALQIKERALGPNHHDVATAHGNVGWALTRSGRLAEARPHLEKALAGIARTLGEKHMLFASALHSHAELLYRQRRYDEARHTLNRATEILDATVEPEHQNYGQVYLTLALVARDTHDYVAADSLFQRALGVGGRYIPLLEEYAAYLRETGRNEEALPFEDKARAIRKELECLE